ncbi:MAG TPA: 4-alpha-glucanotransferase [Pyrinomonadaceae bacterium]|nr:4-alpha-glucanotransferase [Pyrinomonadaceae bacterium]
MAERRSGILLHVTSLPGPYGIGDFGPAAFSFVDFLAASGQKIWQVLPLTPVGESNSPYSSDSAFAGNTLLISPEFLSREGLADRSLLESVPAFPAGEVDYGAVRKWKQELLRHSYKRFSKQPEPGLLREFEQFCSQHEPWLDDYCLFRAIKEATGGLAWIDWESGLRDRDAVATIPKAAALRKEIEAQKFYQFLFFRQWFALKQYASEKGIRIAGDLPIFVAHDSADVWTRRELFKLDQRGRPTVVAGVPPDYFSETGQLWGNPLYDWNRMRSEHFAWWVQRMRLMMHMFDIVRIDHFRGFAACWEVPATNSTAEHGEWVETPGRELFSELERQLGELPVIAEDLGLITPEIERLRADLNFPGMRVLQFAFNSDDHNLHLPHNYEEHTVAFTATHDSDTTVGWFRRAPAIEKEECLRYLGSDGSRINWDFIDAVSSSIADTVIVPLQDALGLGSEARMNVPSVAEGNWKWRARREMLTSELSRMLNEIARRDGRID